MESWKTLNRRTILNHSKFLQVELHIVQLPDGQIIEDWPWVITPDFANVVTETVDGRFLCFRQVKYSIDGPTLAPVGGYLEPGEDPLISAQRELLEETGYEAAEWIELGRFPVDGNRGAGTAYLYLARGAHQVAERNADDLEEQTLVFLTRAEMETALLNGKFKLLPWVTAVALTLAHLKYRTFPNS
ncbi:MAG: NUDIX hydrolase [Ardenticatenaceae bacterium]|nr:NUDIX hydrolase [Ardenticatenaceae bacterium]